MKNLADLNVWKESSNACLHADMCVMYDRVGFGLQKRGSSCGGLHFTIGGDLFTLHYHSHLTTMPHQLGGRVSQRTMTNLIYVP